MITVTIKEPFYCIVIDSINQTPLAEEKKILNQEEIKDI
jgi:hypothetical protein